MKLSIVIPVYNRKELLNNVLRSINMSGDIEIIIVDDGSDEPIEGSIRLNRSNKWRGACVAYNEGFKAATGDVIMINSSECVHVGDVTGYVFKNFKENDYFAFSTYMSTEETNQIINSGADLKTSLPGSWWGVRSDIGNFIPYCGVISKKNMDLLGGYDERFVKGIGFDDYDFTHRVNNLGLNMKCIDDPFVVHQWHKPTEYKNTINYDLLMNLNKNFPDRIKANE